MMAQPQPTTAPDGPEKTGLTAKELFCLSGAFRLAVLVTCLGLLATPGSLWRYCNDIARTRNLMGTPNPPPSHGPGVANVKYPAPYPIASAPAPVTPGQASPAPITIIRRGEPSIAAPSSTTGPSVAVPTLTPAPPAPVTPRLVAPAGPTYAPPSTYLPPSSPTGSGSGVVTIQPH